MTGQPAAKLGKKRRFEVWHAVSISILLAYVLFLVYPMFGILKESVVAKDGGFSLEYFAKFFGQKYYFDTLVNSFKVSLASMAVSLLLGVPLAYFYTAYEMKGRNFIQVMIILCSMSAPFLGAYAWVLLLGRSGVITKALSFLPFMKDFSIYGFNGILLVLSSRLFPLVFLYVSGALKNVDNSLLEASQNMGCGKLKRFFKVILPLVMPSILASALMVFMRAMADFGTPLLIGEGYRTFPVEIYNQYVGETSTNRNFAAAISVVAILITTIIFLVQKQMAKRYSFSISAMHPMERKKPKGLFSFAIHAYTYLLIAISYLPQLYLIYVSFRKTSSSGSVFLKGFSLNSYVVAFKRMSQAIPNTIIIGGLALLLIIIIAIFVAYLVVRRKNKLNSTIDILSMVPYIIPGSVVGIALVIAFSTGPLPLIGTMTIMIVAMCIRRLPYTIRSSVAVLQQIPVTVEEASISLGASKMKTFFKVTVPMMANGIVAGAILSWVTIITELSSSIILYSAGNVTLTLAIYIFVSRGTDGPAAATATILTVFTVISLLLYMKLSKSKDITL